MISNIHFNIDHFFKPPIFDLEIEIQNRYCIKNVIYIQRSREFLFSPYNRIVLWSEMLQRVIKKNTHFDLKETKLSKYLLHKVFEEANLTILEMRQYSKENLPPDETMTVFPK